MAAPSMTHVSHATMSSKPVKPTAAATQSMGSEPVKPSASAEPVPAAKSTPTASAKPMPAAATKSTAAAPATPSSECRDVRHHAERTNRNARCQNSYSFLFHDAFPVRSRQKVVASNAHKPTQPYLTIKPAKSF
jgi:hypothetical protein